MRSASSRSRCRRRCAGWKSALRPGLRPQDSGARRGSRARTESKAKLATPTRTGLVLRYALSGLSVEQVYALTGIDPCSWQHCDGGAGGRLRQCTARGSRRCAVREASGTASPTGSSRVVDTTEASPPRRSAGASARCSSCGHLRRRVRAVTPIIIDYERGTRRERAEAGVVILGAAQPDRQGIVRLLLLPGRLRAAADGF